jgi:hypothetical protein
MVVTAGIIFGAVALFYGYIYRQSAEPAPPRFSDSGVLPPEPRLQVAPAADLERLRSRENEALATYAWIDRDNGVVRIPIEHAMELLVERRKKQ